MGLRASISDELPFDPELNQALGPMEASTPRCEYSALGIAAHKEQQQKGTVSQDREIVFVFSKRACAPGLEKPRSLCVVDRKWWKFGSLDPDFHIDR